MTDDPAKPVLRHTANRLTRFNATSGSMESAETYMQKTYIYGQSDPRLRPKVRD